MCDLITPVFDSMPISRCFGISIGWEIALYPCDLPIYIWPSQDLQTPCYEFHQILRANGTFWPVSSTHWLYESILLVSISTWHVKMWGVVVLPTTTRTGIQCDSLSLSSGHVHPRLNSTQTLKPGSKLFFFPSLRYYSMSLLSRTLTQFSATTIKTSAWSATTRPMLTPLLQQNTSTGG